MRRQHARHQQRTPAPAGRQAQVAAHAGQHADVAGDVACIHAGDEHGIRDPAHVDGGQHIAAGEKHAGQGPVEQAFLARAGQVQQAHAAGHDDGGQRGGDDECERIHFLPWPTALPVA
jgi:hypothetical protein